MEPVTEDRVEGYRRVLGLRARATVADVQRSYRREMRRWHPDRIGGDGERARLLNEAREYLLEHPGRIRPAQVAESPRSTSPAPTARASAPPPRTPSASPPPAAAPRSADAGHAVDVKPPEGVGWRLVGGAIQVVRFLVIAYVALFIFALVGYILTVVLPWFLKVVVPIVGSPF